MPPHVSFLFAQVAPDDLINWPKLIGIASGVMAIAMMIAGARIVMHHHKQQDTHHLVNGLIIIFAGLAVFAMSGAVMVIGTKVAHEGFNF